MRNLLFDVAAGAAVVLLTACGGKEYPLETVEKVDLERYMGTSYEIASIPTSFQKGCHCTTAEYSMPKGKDYVKVLNKCRKGGLDADWDKASGKAFVTDKITNAKLKVQFFWPFKGKYWIIGLDEEYNWAVVGHPNRNYLWILSRTPAMDDTTYQKLVDLAAAKDFDTSNLVKADQRCYTDDNKADDAQQVM